MLLNNIVTELCNKINILSTECDINKQLHLKSAIKYIKILKERGELNNIQSLTISREKMTFLDMVHTKIACKKSINELLELEKIIIKLGGKISKEVKKELNENKDQIIQFIQGILIKVNHLTKDIASLASIYDVKEKYDLQVFKVYQQERRSLQKKLLNMCNDILQSLQQQKEFLSFVMVEAKKADNDKIFNELLEIQNSVHFIKHVVSQSKFLVDEFNQCTTKLEDVTSAIEQRSSHHK